MLAMLDNRPVLKDRLRALAVFSGIAIGGVSGIEMVIGGGFDPITPGLVAEAPSEYDPDTVMRAWHYQPYVPAAFVTETAQYYDYPIEVFETPPQPLAGGEDETDMTLAAAAPSEEELYREIERMLAADVRATEPETAAGPESAALTEAAPVDAEPSPAQMWDTYAGAGEAMTPVEGAPPAKAPDPAPADSAAATASETALPL